MNYGGDSGIDYTGDNFLDTAFSAKEQNAIVETTVVNYDNKDEDYGTDGEGGDDTVDRIFLLSINDTDNIKGIFPRILYEPLLYQHRLCGSRREIRIWYE